MLQQWGSERNVYRRIKGTYLHGAFFGTRAVLAGLLRILSLRPVGGDSVQAPAPRNSFDRPFSLPLE